MEGSKGGVGQLRDDLEDAGGLAHGRLQMKRLHVLPVLLQQGDQEVDGQHGVGQKLIFGHLDVANGDTQAQDLLQLELDRGLQVVDLVPQVVAVGDGGREFTSLGETGTQQTGNLLDQSFRSEESIVLLRQLLDQLLVLVELLQIIHTHVFEIDLLCPIDIGSISENADGHAGTRNIGELDGPAETLVPLGIVILEADLEFDSLDELPLLVAIADFQQFLDRASHA